MTATGARKWGALGGVMLAVLAVDMDLTVLSVALPTLSGALRASESDLQWFSSAYALVLAAAMLPAGLLGDRYGRKKVMLFALALFAAGSLACAYSRTPAEFIGARVLLGCAGAGLVVMAVSALTVLFTEEERPKALGIWAAANMFAFPIGPILGGWLLSHYWWGWVFLMNVPVAVVGFVAVVALVPESRSALRPGVDTVGIVQLERRPRRCDLRAHRGGRARVELTWRARPAFRRGGSDSGVLRLGASAGTQARRPAPCRLEPVPLPVVHLGRNTVRRSYTGFDRPSVHDAPVLPGSHGHGPGGIRCPLASGCRRDARRVDPCGTRGQSDRCQADRLGGLSRARRRARNGEYHGPFVG